MTTTSDLLNDEGDFDALLKAFIRDPDAPRPEWAFDPNRGLDEQLNETPFFMTELPQNAEDNVKLQALQALLYDGTPEENATNFKEQGNEAFKRGPSGYQDALIFYTKGINEKPNNPFFLAQLYNNRAAVHLALKNFGFAARDAAFSLSQDENSNVKAFFRAAKASLALEKISEAEKFCQRGLQVFPGNSDLSLLSTEILATKIRLEEEKARIEKGKETATKLQKALKQRGVNYHVDAEKRALIELGPGLLGSDAPRATLDKKGRISFPIVFMYPPLSQFDFVQCAREDTCFLDHLTEMFAQPAPWDPQILYNSPLNMTAYILPINESILNDDDKTEKSIYRVNLRTPLNRLIGSVIKCYELGILAVYILPNSEEKKKFELKFKDHRILDI